VNNARRNNLIQERRNFEQVYKRLVDTWILYDNSGERPFLLDAGGTQ